jgi:hypothetical protein
MDLTSKQFNEKPKKIGTLKDKPVFHLKTKGGLHLLVTQGKTGYSTLGSGPHSAVAKHIALKNEPDILFTELNKADHIDIEAFELLLPKYEAITVAIQKLGEI